MKEVKAKILLPKCKFCGHRCSDGCAYWDPYKKDGNGRTYCRYYGHYYFPHERQGCLSYR